MHLVILTAYKICSVYRNGRYS